MKKTENGTPIVNQEQLIKILNTSPKGITTMGDVGVGKSHVYNQKFKTCNFDPEGTVYSANKISSIYAAGGMDAITDKFSYELQGRLPLIIDDIGTEIIMGHYGTKLDVVQWLILECYNADTKMYFTTNLTLEALTVRYGKRVMDRIKEKTYIIVLEGDSHRERVYQNTEKELDILLK